MRKFIKKILPVFFSTVFFVSPVFAQNGQKKIYPKNEALKNSEIVLDFKNSAKKEDSASKKNSSEKKQILPYPKDNIDRKFDSKLKNPKKEKDFEKKNYPQRKDFCSCGIEHKREKFPKNPPEIAKKKPPKDFPPFYGRKYHECENKKR